MLAYGVGSISPIWMVWRRRSRRTRSRFPFAVRVLPPTFFWIVRVRSPPFPWIRIFTCQFRSPLLHWLTIQGPMFPTGVLLHNQVPAAHPQQAAPATQATGGGTGKVGMGIAI